MLAEMLDCATRFAVQESLAETCVKRPRGGGTSLCEASTDVMRLQARLLPVLGHSWRGSYETD